MKDSDVVIVTPQYPLNIETISNIELLNGQIPPKDHLSFNLIYLLFLNYKYFKIVKFLTLLQREIKQSNSTM